MHRMHLEELTRRLRAGGQDPTAEEMADAVWLAQWLPHAPADPGAERTTGPPAPGPSGEGRKRAGGAGTEQIRETGPAPDLRGDRTSETVALHMESGGARRGGAGVRGGAALPVRAPGANALPGLLGLQKALRPLRHSTLFPPRPGEGLLDEEATAERTAAAGILTPVLRPAAGRRPDIQLLMDTGPAMVVWARMVEELRQACQQSGAFRDVQVHRLYDTGEGPPLVTTTSGTDGRPRLRPADQLHDPTGRRLTLIVSDCVGPLWQRGAVQRLIHQWPRQSPLAVVQPLPPRLWPRTALTVEPGTLLRPSTPGGHTVFQPDEEPWEPVPADSRAVPVLTPTPEAFASWARLFSGHGAGPVRGWAARIDPEAVRRERAAPPAAPPRPPRGDDELLSAFRAGASPGALRLAVHLAAAPLTLPVMQLVQRAMLPDTGPMELAEVLLSGLLRQLPGPSPYPCFSYPPGVQQYLLGSLDRSAAALVLKHCSAYVERNFGQSMRNFPALAAARLAGHDPEDEEPATADESDEPTGPLGPEPELFARIPARVLRFYHPDLVTPEPLAEAERLLARGRGQSDPSLLADARERAEAALPDDAVRARIVLGRILHAEAGTGAVRGTRRRHELLTRAVAELARAAELAGTGSREWADARLELAVVHHALWRHTDDPAHLDAALDALAGDPGDWPETDHPALHLLHLRRGRLLLARGDGPAAVAELTAALRLTESGPVLLDLADALHLAGADPAEIASVLDRAGGTLGDSAALRLRWTTARARLYDAVGDAQAADAAYEEATLLAPDDSERRGRILMTWGESLMRRAAADTGTQPVDRAESVLREALTRLPADAPGRDRARILIGSVLALRFHRAGFLPDLFESRHLLEQAARTTRDAGTRSEVWLQLGRVRLELSETARDGVLADALTAYERSWEDARAAHGDTPGTVTGARALHAQGAVLRLMGRNGRARTVLRAAAEQWSRLVAAGVEVDRNDVERTRESLAATGTGRERATARLSEGDRRRIAPPWWAWSETA
ncbi:SAV_2336 N-terminal domain-related protein [Streptomyces sp. NPDC003027]